MTIRDEALKGCTALVTGGSRGIGRAVSEALAARGAKVVINYRSREDAALETAELVTKAGGEAVLAGFDVADADVVADKVKEIGTDHGLHIVVNNAGIAINGLLMRFKPEDWQRTLDVNVSSMFHVTKAASRYLLKAKEQGRVINISSVVGEVGNGGQAAYAASKAAILGFTKAIAKELSGRGITVNAVTPGYIETDMTAAELPENKRAELLATIPLGRIGNAADVAGTVAFLAGPEAAYVTGQVLRVNGGMLM
jgi:3-oxoacyl-[acyl-carrier protein] reductase